MLALKELQRRFIKRICHERRSDEARPHRIDTDATGCMLECCALGRAKNTMLGADIGTRIGKAHRAEDRRHVDDCATSRLLDLWNGKTHAIENAGKVDVDF